MALMNWLWRIRICKLNWIWRWFWNAEIGNFWVPQPFFKKITSAGLNSLNQKKYQISVKIGFLMIHFTKRGQYWTFWCQGWTNHLEQEVFWWNRVFEAVEVSEVAGVDQVNEAAEVLGPKKITTDDFRVIQVLEFTFILLFGKTFLGGWIMKYHIEI